MNSHAANLFLSLQQTISSLGDGKGTKYFRFVDQDYGQLEHHSGDMRVPVSWPCVLIDIDNLTYQSIGSNAQTGVATIILRLGFPPFSSSSNITPKTYREKALYYYDLEQVLHLALQGNPPTLIVDDTDLLADVFGAFDRTSATTERRDDFIRVRTITYTLGMEDYSTKPTLTYTTAALDLNTSFTFPDTE